ncbi:aminopeptidase N [Pseudoalteromonas shioyasakiensis]|uniref:Aminopeptidase N n=1 Tax=Pseudoalteromonas shioyasakiensis TaxID=1190813 RepID=A0ABT6TVL5_9GAMM|nr:MULTISPECIES: aminopeptidase N [Pseudoalteromonas]MDI4667944.1 aminopeptidase N [Pseudoalteromonas shioyasakiensis]MDI4672826.1 aminopeptidase N [Pseudoalteromonas shioyasakiensis]MDI4684890.1 aminopeptidase N [Pseudoalteromonas shioyasakiensis]MDI4703146.1 aminopeptidase N [Pseudoalteromonas shioyasakiensis]NUJ20227.1 aminopeptidase N [Pseudoalteromonas sp. 0802]
MSATSKPQAQYLKDYQAPQFSIQHIDLRFELAPLKTSVQSTMTINRTDESNADLALDGVDLTLISVKVDDKAYDDYTLEDEKLIIHNLPESFILKIENHIDPQTNTSLEGLYLSGGAYCTQCEAEGFRKITYYLDRPDVLASFYVTIIADKKYTHLLSNGNQIESGNLDDGRHFVKWQDPFKKPSYLFALVAGDFDVLRDHYTTQSGRKVELALFVDKGNLSKTPHAMTSLKKSMQWDEERFNLEYDLDIYMIVAVDFFNMGAMENKGLNIFNSKCVLANQETATDKDYHTIESIVGHEYFHNWTGNRVTCRDWFQLSLKEGLTVFRDQEFSSDLGSRALNRIDAVKVMRTHQFSEDAGPMAHPIRPEKVIEMNNFYTVTVYDKGAEVIRMMHTLLGEEKFQQGMALYFERHDGQAVTCDDFVAAMSDASGIDLTQFKRWYSQAGTPKLNVEQAYDEQNQTFTLNIEQFAPDNQPNNALLHIPFAIELLDSEGQSLPLVIDNQPQDSVLNVTEKTQQFVFEGIKQRPVAVLLEDFSAPCIVNQNTSAAELLHIMRFARSDFSRWDAQQRLFTNEMKAAIASGEACLSDDILSALKLLVDNREGDLALIAELLKLPSYDTLAAEYAVIPVDDIIAVQNAFESQIANFLTESLVNCYNALEDDGSTSATAVAVRALKQLCLHYLAKTNHSDVNSLIEESAHSNNMTNALAALSAVVKANHSLCDTLLTEFDAKWRHDVLVMDKWFALQAMKDSATSISDIKALYDHPSFDFGNPNRVRALVGSFSHFNITQFHRADGKGYQLLGDLLVKLNDINPQNASRMLTPFMSWKRYDENRSAAMKAQLQRLADLDGLSDDLFEKVEKALES